MKNLPFVELDEDTGEQIVNFRCAFTDTIDIEKDLVPHLSVFEDDRYNTMQIGTNSGCLMDADSWATVLPTANHLIAWALLVNAQSDAGVVDMSQIDEQGHSVPVFILLQVMQSLSAGGCVEFVMKEYDRDETAIVTFE